MPNDQSPLPAVETGPRVLVHPSADRRLAAEHWLLSTSRNRERVRQEWADTGVALLPLGGLISAVRLPARMVLAVADELQAPSPGVDAFLAEALEDGPVICDPRSRAYYALVPGSTPRTWQMAATEWCDQGVDLLGRDVYLGVPRLDRTELDPSTYATYWSVPMPSAGALCSPLQVARLIAAGQHLLAELGPEA